MAARIDRIAEPWGTRTPYTRDEAWPTRVDMFLDDGLTEDDVDDWVQTAAILHSNGDGLDIAVTDGRIVGVCGRVVDGVNLGRLGPKDLFGWQANGSPDRLTHPLVRKRGELVRATWDEAMERVTGRTTELLAEQGRSAIGFYTSGQLFLEEYCTLAVVAHGGLGTIHVDGNTRLCTATAAASLTAPFGRDGQPGSYTDVDHADVIALWGHNVAETHWAGDTGSGDMLAGAVAGLLAGGADAAQAACWALALHGMAGDKLAARIGPLGYLARDLVDELPAILVELQA